MMNKQEFLEELYSKLHELSEEDKKKSIDYYSEIIDDRVEEGMSEEAAVDSLGYIGDIALQILIDNETLNGVKKKDVKKNTGNTENKSAGGTTPKFGDDKDYVSFDDYMDQKMKKMADEFSGEGRRDDVYENDRIIRKEKKKKSGGVGVKIVLFIFFFPFILTFACTLFGLGIGMCGLVFGLIAGFVGMCAGFIGAGVGSIASLILNVIQGNVAGGVFSLGVGLFLSGLGILLISATGKVVQFGINLIKGMFRMFIGIFRRRTA
ncbi:Protein of unknown function [Eubacterium ruminantium]|nr:Protein of unknown function [Eubacterium ruminantium]